MADTFKLYVGNLNYKTTEESLKSALSIVQDNQEQLISVNLRRHKDTSKSKGWASAEYATKAGCDEALRLHNRKLIDNRSVYMRRDIIDKDSSYLVYLGNLPYRDFDDLQLEQLFENYNAYSVRICHSFSGKSRGFGIAKFDKYEDAQRVITDLHQTNVLDRRINVRWDEAPKADKVESNIIFISGLSKHWYESDVMNLCKEYGQIIDVKLFFSTIRDNKWGLITYQEIIQASNAIEAISARNIPGIEIRFDKKQINKTTIK